MKSATAVRPLASPLNFRAPVGFWSMLRSQTKSGSAFEISSSMWTGPFCSSFRVSIRVTLFSSSRFLFSNSSTCFLIAMRSCWRFWSAAMRRSSSLIFDDCHHQRAALAKAAPPAKRARSA